MCTVVYFYLFCQTWRTCWVDDCVGSWVLLDLFRLIHLTRREQLGPQAGIATNGAEHGTHQSKNKPNTNSPYQTVHEQHWHLCKFPID